MANPLDDVTQNRRDDSGNPLRRVYIDTSDAPVAQGAGAGNALMQSMQPAAAEAVPWTIEDLQRGVEAIKQYVAGNVAPVNDMAKRFTNYDRQFTQDVINAPTTIWGNPTAADKVGQRFMGGENWLSNMVRSATTSPGKALASETPVTSEQMIAPAQDIAGMATGSMLFGKPGAATLGAGPVRPAMKPSLVPAIKFEGRVYRAEPGVNHLDMVPPKLQKFMDKNGIEDLHDIPENTPGFGIGFVNHKGHFLSREGEAAKYAAQYPELIIPEARDIVKQGAMSSDFLMFSDSQPGTAVSALAQSAKGPAPVFYSALEYAATNAAQETMNPQQWLGFLKNTPGVKAEELAWTGLPEWLGTQKGKVKKEDVKAYLDEHKVEIKDVTKAGKQASDLITDDVHDLGVQAVLDAFLDENPKWVGKEHTAAFERAHERFAESERGEQIYNDAQQQVLEPEGSTKYSDYQLPGGENYREHLLTMPQKDKTRLGDWSVQPSKDYHSSHWDEPNVLAHVRTNDREFKAPADKTGMRDLATVDAEMDAIHPRLTAYEKQHPEFDAFKDPWPADIRKDYDRLLTERNKIKDADERTIKSLHIEEIQSDWHQQGRKQGYRHSPKFTIEPDPLNSGKFRVMDGRTEYVGDLDKVAAENIIQREQGSRLRLGGVPDAPFKTSWPELALKRMIRKAAEEGYDRISWTPGEAQAARYDLSKSIDKIYYNPDKNILIAYDKNSGRPAIEKHDIKPGQLADVIGKEAADKIINNPSSKEKGNHVLSNADLKVGGEGMREFYDKMLPKMVEKIGKTHGVRVKQIKLPSDNIRKTVDDRYTVVGDKRTFDTMAEAQEAAGQPVHYFDLPQSLKEHAIGKGFPLYMSGVPFPLTPVDHDPFKKGNK